ncbi:MAG: hypothetical protein ACON4U_19860 [Myxococcota bacterium]
MVYIVIAFGAVFLLFWGLTLMFAFRSTGERSIFIPSFFILIFLSIFTFGGIKWKEAQENPDLLTVSNLTSIQFGAEREEVAKVFGEREDLTLFSPEELRKYDLSTNRINVPLNIRSRMKPGEYQADRLEAGIKFSVVGDPSTRGFAKPLRRDEIHPVTLGSTAESGNGVTGMVLRIYLNDADAEQKIKDERKAAVEAAKEAKTDLPEFSPMIVPALDGKEWMFSEGTDFTYDDNEDDESLVAEIAAIIDATPEFCTEFDPEDDPIRFEVKPECGCEKFNALLRQGNSAFAKPAVEGCKEQYSEEGNYLGENGNNLRMQVLFRSDSTSDELSATPNRSVFVNGSSSSKPQSFRGGYNKAALDYWYEIDPLLDDDFNTTPRLVVAGYISDKLVSLGQNGLFFPEGEYFNIPEERCNDNYDEDGDGQTDCSDSDCAEHPLCLQ